MAKVVFVLEVPTPQRTPVLNELAERGIDLYAAYYQGADTERGWGDTGITHRSGEIPVGVLRAGAYLIRAVFSPDTRVLCCFGYSRPANVAAILAARVRGVRVVTRSDSNYQTELSKPRLRRAAKRVFLRALFGARTRVWTVGTENDRYWKSIGLGDRRLIPYGTPKPPVGAPEDGRRVREEHSLGSGMVFLSVGMLEPWKGTDILVAAFLELRDPEARLLIVGKGSLEPIVSEAVGKDDRITYLGSREQSELGPIYASADVLVLPSRREAWGLVVDEAQCNGLGVIVSDAVGCAPDRINDRNDWIFRSGDSSGLRREMVAASKGRARGRVRPPGYNAAPAMAADLEDLLAEVRVQRA